MVEVSDGSIDTRDQVEGHNEYGPWQLIPSYDRLSHLAGAKSRSRLRFLIDRRRRFTAVPGP